MPAIGGFLARLAPLLQTMKIRRFVSTARAGVSFSQGSHKSPAVIEIVLVQKKVMC